ncbi:ATP-dependent zinc protease family protein [Shewanella psychromarinicola]|uniref:ATP-dependent zinc protease n=1 Tax=Shewanella psychromarinicola TaxID=2487742 RepID=A0A3N4E0Q3_9GAMM|nr:ATP-dependent zinc protease [Shewanella psychromarinicola]AZG36060.1 ATP-dependent zinc protease [Shewanella psychromarinicola]MCL1080429.1 ATP-dependent zinc protease [Shewanella psychromarinicola]RPA31749.1 ATP-dependent zinc protease [Shewanella psychromarinicola]
MLKQVIALSVVAALIAGCSVTQKPITPPLTNVDFNNGLQVSQTVIIDAINSNNSQQTNDISALSTEIRKLKTQVSTAMRQKSETIMVQPPMPKMAEVKQCPESIMGEKFLLGEVESVFIDELKVKFATRIDTGAESSSLDARNIVLFEREGEQWVRFDVMTNGFDQPGNTFESEVEHFIRIKQDVDTGNDRRPVIHAHLKIGKYSAETELNLTDRSHLDYPLLLGRKFMKDIAIVDVGQMYIHGKAKNQITTLIK